VRGESGRAEALSWRILVFDSGMGGLTVARAIRAELPDAELVYAADSAAFPYGAWREEPLVERIDSVVKRLIEEIEPDAVVIACNTASTLALPQLRSRHKVPFVGTVPAIKPAAAQTRSGVIGVLATPGTVAREYTQALIHTFAFHCRVVLHGAPHLAEMAEARLAGAAPDHSAIAREIAPVFRDIDGARTDVVVLGCTHYPLLLPELVAAAPWPVTFIDPAPAIARRTAAVVAGLGEGPKTRSRPLPGLVCFTDAREPGAAYAAMGFNRVRIIPMPVGA
jgi:glutamate racemase